MQRAAALVVGISLGGKNPPSSLRQKHRRVATFFLLILGLAVILLALGGYSADLLFIVAVAPSSYLLWHFYHADKYRHESLRLLFFTFAIGAGMSVVAGIVESPYNQPSPEASILILFLYFLLGIGLVEEVSKYLAVRVYAYRSAHFDEAIDGIVFGVAAALGFATVENVLYVFQFGIVTGVVRAIVTVPGHAFWGAIMGFYLGQAKVQNKPTLVIQGLGIAALFHGLFDTLSTILPDLVGLAALAAFVWLTYAKVVRHEIKTAEAELPFGSSPNSG